MASDPHSGTEMFNVLCDLARGKGLEVGLLVGAQIGPRGRERRDISAITLYERVGTILRRWRRVDHQVLSGDGDLQAAAECLIARRFVA